MKLLVGLGNPGGGYELTRHNAGFLILDLIAEDAGASFSSQKKFEAEVAKGSILGHETVFLKPQTFMNLSGKSVSRVMAFYKIRPEDVIVLHDDIDMAFSKVKAKVGGGHGGHNGIRSILQETGQAEFHRLKLGVGRPTPEDKTGVSQWVLNPFTDQELLTLQKEMLDAVMLRLDGIYKTT